VLQLRVVLKYLSLGPAFAEQLDDELDRNPSPPDDRFAHQHCRVDFDSSVPVHVQIIAFHRGQSS
jgi:hypothetical protein